MRLSYMQLILHLLSTKNRYLFHWNVNSILFLNISLLHFLELP